MTLALSVPLCAAAPRHRARGSIVAAILVRERAKTPALAAPALAALALSRHSSANT